MLRRLWRWKWVIMGVGVIASQIYGLWIDLDGNNKWGPGFIAGLWFNLVSAEILDKLDG